MTKTKKAEVTESTRLFATIKLDAPFDFLKYDGKKYGRGETFQVDETMRDHKNAEYISFSS